MTSSCTVVVPCFNEGRRLDPTQLEALADLADARVLAVDDGSTDDTATLLGKLADGDPGRFEVVSLGTNRGKGEAVRHGLLAAVAGGAELVAYCDADFATPPGEMARLITELRARDRVDAVIGSRVALMGTDIRRSALRHYTGRLFATASSLVLGVPVYDTQCGSKAFRVTKSLRDAISVPFVSRWAFDVELLGRLLHATGAPSRRHDVRFLELPLETWREPGGSKLTPAAAAQAGVDLLRIHRRLRAADPHHPGRRRHGSGSANSATESAPSST
jgi:dolichyl-phosphate beta-glucosyltransferase